MRRHLTTAAVIALVAATACSNASDEADDQPASIDARAFYEEYEAGADDDSQRLFGTAEAEDGAIAPDAGSPEKIVPCNDCGPLPPRREPPITAGNTFDDAGTNPVVNAAKQPTSTFGLDVDTGSYRVAQHLLKRNLLPPGASVRPEEWINAYDYGTAAPTTSDLGVSAETSASPRTSTQLLRVGVDAREFPDSERPPAALTFVVDTSGSMDIRERLGLVKASLALLAKSLRPDDTISIVTYDNQARSVLEPTSVDDTDTILAAIDDLKPGGGTNLSAGVDLGYKYAAQSADKAGINAVILASDGVANIGLTNPSGLADKVNSAASKDDIQLVTVGYGMGNYNDDLMEQLADQGQGFYSYVSTYADAKRLFVDDLTGTLGVVANDAKAQVEFDPAAVESYRLIGYENRAMSDAEFDDSTADAGEVGSGMDVTALYEVTPSEDAAPSAPIGTATVRWESATGGSQEEASTEIRMPGISAAPSDATQLAGTVAEFAETIKHDQGTKALDVRLRALRDTADSLADDGVEGAGELSTMIGQAIEAHPTGGPYEIQ
ncbi:vWA domain-containing protein [Solicola gregarius]|uniref:von Willebrand factor type A domain-containing protein n=1 Tax=Solicola gregarius TaxID=2908642 RepID=A0AA46TKL0_9ACTN|nr:von Willebrand factor type A domain-containing protein [Solicola gregarius]UYM06843.1 von Willebrand factor type A domain-containing protein [Solicola gregarius]